MSSLTGSLPEDAHYLDELEKLILNYPIEILRAVPYETLLSFYGRAKIYWHAAGYDEDLDTHPERAEHFGITTVEAMSAGAVPVVIAAGGQTEIVRDKETGLLWKTVDELEEKNTTIS